MNRNKPSLEALPGGVITVMFTDIVNSTRLKGLMEGDISARRDARFHTDVKMPHDAILRTCVKEAHGYVVNSTGDGYCFTFVDAEEAVLCALRIQAHLRFNPIATPLGPLEIRIGLHTGSANPAAGDYSAGTLDKAARIQSKAEGGQIVVSYQTHALVADKIQGVAFDKAGMFDLKGLASEDLYRAIALPDLRLAPVPFVTRTELHQEHTHQKRRSLLWMALAAVVLFFAFFLYLQPQFRASEPKAQEVHSLPAQSALQAGSRWEGNFHFQPPYGGSGELFMTINKRVGNTFEGRYSSENGGYVWQIRGIIQNSAVHWEFTRLIHKPENTKDEATGIAYVEATLQGNVLAGRYYDKLTPKDIADIKLSLASVK